MFRWIAGSIFVPAPPPEWLISLRVGSYRYLYCCLLITGAIHVPNAIRTRNAAGTVANALISFVSVTCLYLSRLRRGKRNPFFTESIAACSMGVFHLLGSMAICLRTDTDPRVRSRYQGAILILPIMFPSYLWLRPKTTFLLNTWVFLVHAVHGYFTAAWYGDITFMWFVYAFAFCCIGTVLASGQNVFSLKLHDALQALNSKKLSMETLLGMICDATISIGSDGVRVVNTHVTFDGCLGCSMQGMDITSVLEVDEQSRLQDALKRARDMPQSLIMTLTTNTRKIDAKLFIAAYHFCEGPQDAEKPAFMLGLKFESDDTTCYNRGTMTQSTADAFENIVAHRGTSLDGNTLDDAGTALESVPESSVAGRIFTDLQKIVESNGDGNCSSCLESQLAIVAEVGREEKWLLEVGSVHLYTNHVLGRGGCGVVIAGALHGTDVAVKTAGVPAVDVNHIGALANELKILRHIRHPNIVAFHGAVVMPDKGELLIVLERISGIPISKFMRKDNVLSALYRRQLILDVATALRYLHTQWPQIVHGDLKGGNILVAGSTSPRATLLDFGLARKTTRVADPLAGTVRWMAPEVLLRRERPSAKADVFSFGHVICLIATGLKPLMSLANAEIVKRAKENGFGDVTWESNTIHIMKANPCRILCEKMLRCDARQRPNMEEVNITVASWPNSVFDEMEGHLSLESTEDALVLELLRHFTFENCTGLNCCPLHSAVRRLKAVVFRLGQRICGEIGQCVERDCPICRVCKQSSQPATLVWL